MSAVKNRALALSLLAAGAVGGMSGAAWATPSPPTPIAVVNPSFEANNPGNTAGVQYNGGVGSQDYYAFGSFTGWAWNGGSYAGWWHPSTLEYPGGGSTSVAATNIPNGQQIAFVNGGATLTQVLAATLVSNATYTLTFSVGQRPDIVLPTNYFAEVFAGNHLLQTWSNQMTPTPTTPGAGAFASESLSFTSQTLNDPYAGLPLGIVLGASGATSSEANFDALGLSVVTGVNVVPEPATLGLLLVGLVGTLFVSRRRVI